MVGLSFRRIDRRDEVWLLEVCSQMHDLPPANKSQSVACGVPNYGLNFKNPQLTIIPFSLIEVHVIDRNEL